MHSSFSEQNGTISPDGRFIGGPAGQYSVVARVRNQAAIADSARVNVWETDNELVELIVFPDSAMVGNGDSLKATAALRLSNGDLTQQAEVTWTASGGSIDENGTFSAPDSGTYVLTAVSSVGLSGRATVLVHQKPRQFARISVDPPTATLLRGQSTSFTATGYNSDGSTSPVNVAWSATGGSISSSGQYVAGGASGSFVVSAREPSSGLVDTAFVTITTPSVVRLVMSPESLAIDPGATRQFTALAELSDATWQTVPLAWTASAGSISSSGVFTAPSQPGSYSVIVTSPGLSVADTASVIVTTPTATLTAIRINPSSATVGAGESRQFSATADWSDGSHTTPAVTWSAGGGAISPSGRFTAGATAGTFEVIGRAANGLADTSSVVVTAPVLTSLSLSPGSATIVTGGTVQFSVSGTWSNGGSAAPVVSWNVSGGNMNGSGVYTAGSQAGTFAIIATQQGGTLADTSFVTVSTAAPTLTGLLLTPSSAVLAPGGWLDFTVIGTWSNGSTSTPPVTYTATGGTMSGNRYTAGSTAGTYRVIARHTSGKADTSSVVISIPVTLSSLSVSPAAPSVAVGASQQFTISATWSNGSTALPLVNWTATGGTITTGGKYTAGSTTGSYRVIVAHQGGTLRDTANVTILGSTPTAPTLTSLTVAPDPVSVAVSTTKQFTLNATWSDGSTTAPAVTWAATGGSVSSAGLYTAGTSAGTYRVVATQQGGGKADTAAVTITTSAPLPPPPPSTGSWKEPGGYYPIVGRHFTTLGTGSNGRGTGSFPWKTGGSEGWDDAESRYSNITLAQDATAPLSANSIVRMLYPAQTVANNTTYSPGVAQMMDIVTATNHYGQSRHYRKLYFRTAFRVSENWQGHPSSTNKLFFIRSESGHEPIVRLRGAGSNALQLNVDLQGSRRDRRNIGAQSSLGPNRGVDEANHIRRGKWYVLEGVLEIGTNGQSNGTLRLWLDGALTHSYSDIEYEATGKRSDWGYIHIAPTWGGGQGTINQLMWLDFDDFYVSGAP